MKTHNINRPRFTCRVARGWITLFGDVTTGKPRGFGTGHVANCNECRSFLGAGDQLELALKRDAAREVQVVPSGLDQRIIFALNLSGSKRHSRRTRYLPLALTGVVACLALTILIFQKQTPSVHEATTTNPVLATEDLWTSLKPSADALLSSDPLQQEVDAVVSDARSAFHFLKRNFLPSPPKGVDSRG